MSGRVREATIAVVAVASVVVLVFPLFDEGLAVGNDVGLHVGNVVECAYLLRHRPSPWDGVPDVAGGRGGPNYLYYGSIAFLLPAILVNLGLSPIAALKVLIGATWLLATLSSFLWCRLHGGRIGGVAGAALFLHGPYLVSLPYARGAYPEFLAAALAPLVFYLAHRWVTTKGWGFLVGGAAVLTFVFCSHTLALILVGPFLAVYAVSAGLLGMNRKVVLYACVLLLLGLLLSFHFHAGPLFESDAEVYERLGVPWYSLLNRESVAGQIVSHALPGRVHLVALGAALLAAFAGRSANRLRVALVTIFALCGLLLSEASLAKVTVALAPPLKYLQFPWRWLGMFNLFSAAAFASLFRARSGLPPRWWVSAAAAPLIVCAVSSIEMMPNQDAVRFRTETRAKMRRSLTTLDHENKYMPVGSKLPKSPAPEVLLEVAGGRVTELEKGLNDYRYEVVAPTALDAAFHQYYFGGWRCEIDGKEVELTRVGELGICGFEIPEGTHTVRVWFGRTPLRLAAMWVSAGTALVLLGILIGEGVRGVRKRWINRSGDRWRGCVTAVANTIRGESIDRGTLMLP